MNQIELHPYFQQRSLRAFHAQHGIVTQAWSPFGGGGSGSTGTLLEDPAITAIAAKRGCQASQIVLAWLVEEGLSVIPKATSSEHLAANLASIDIKLDAQDLQAIATLDRRDGRAGPNPMTLNITQALG